MRWSKGANNQCLSMSRIAEEITSAVTNRVKMVKSSETERKERMDTSSLMEQILSSDNLNRHICKSYETKVQRRDGMKYTEPKEHLQRTAKNIKEQLRTREKTSASTKSGDTKTRWYVRNLERNRQIRPHATAT